MPGYDPNSSDAKEPVRTFPPGEYNAVVEGAEERLGTSSGEPQIKLTLTVYGPDDKTRTVFDYLTFGKMLYKVRHFCESAGIDFSKGTLGAFDCEGKSVRVKLKLKGEERDVRSGKTYPAKNEVDDYVERDLAASSPSGGVRPRDEDIPF